MYFYDRNFEMTFEIQDKDRLYVVTGATGNTGRVVAGTLPEHGRRVRVIDRSLEVLRRILQRPAELCVVDPIDRAAPCPSARGIFGGVPRHRQAGARAADQLREAAMTPAAEA
jgi:nucleoside-diphosphate-sugar epimerase